MIAYRYDPLRWFNQVQRELAGVAEQQRARVTAWVPEVDVQEHADRYVLCVDVPGVDPQKIEVKTEDGVLTVSGERESEATDAVKYQLRERSVGRFARRFTLPERVDADKITAQNRNGVLSIVIPKSAATQPRTINIEH